MKILGDKLAELQLTRSTVSEALRIFLESHGFDTEVCNVMRTKTFHALPPDTKAAVLGFLVEELNGSNIVTRLARSFFKEKRRESRLIASNFLFLTLCVVFISATSTTR